MEKTYKIFQLTQYLVNGKANPANAEAEMLAEFAEFGHGHNITADALFDFIDHHYPDLTEEQVKFLLYFAKILANFYNFLPTF